jgi:hypothetical protein
MGRESWISPAYIVRLLAFDHGAADSMRFAERQREKRSQRETLRLCLSAGMLYCLGGSGVRSIRSDSGGTSEL